MMRLPVFFARRFVAGEALDDACGVAREYQRCGIATALDHLGENVKERAGAGKAARAYANILREISRSGLNADISIKLSQLGLAIDKKLALRYALMIVREARRLGVMVEVDMESSKYTQDTLDIYYSLLEVYGLVVVAV